MDSILYYSRSKWINTTVMANNETNDMKIYQYSLSQLSRPTIDRVRIIGAIGHGNHLRDYHQREQRWTAGVSRCPPRESILGNRGIRKKEKKGGGGGQRRGKKKEKTEGSRMEREDFDLQAEMALPSPPRSQDGHFLRSQSTVIGYCS